MIWKMHNGMSCKALGAAMSDSNKNTITVIVCRVGEEPAVEQVENDLQAFQTAVGGNLDAVALAPGVALYCHDYGMYECTPNRMIGATPIFGNFIITAFDSAGESVSMTEAQVDEWLARVRFWPVCGEPNAPQIN